MKSKQRTIILASFIMISIGIFMYFIFSSMINEKYLMEMSLNSILIYKGLPILSIIFGVGLLLYYYLEIGFKSRVNIPEDRKLSETRFQKLFLDFKTDVSEQLKGIENKEVQTEKVEELINDAVKDRISGDVLEEFESRYTEKAIQELHWKRLEEYTETLEYNLEKYIAKLSRNSTINLVIGTLTTIIAVLILGFMVFEKEIDFSDTTNVIGHYIPRISISIFIEIFSFFFLKLYRTNLNDVKYFENERTNIKSKLLAFKTAYLLKDNDSMKLSIESLINTERNFKLKKDESTVDLEKTRINSEQETKWMEFFANIWNAKK